MEPISLELFENSYNSSLPKGTTSVTRKSLGSAFFNTHLTSVDSSVKLIKTHIRRILRDVKLMYTTLLMQIEACLNSRPLVPLPNDDADHFLIGELLAAFLETTPTGSIISLLKLWQLCKNLLGHFWKY